MKLSGTLNAAILLYPNTKRCIVFIHRSQTVGLMNYTQCFFKEGSVGTRTEGEYVHICRAAYIRHLHVGLLAALRKILNFIATLSHTHFPGNKIKRK